MDCGLTLDPDFFAATKNSSSPSGIRNTKRPDVIREMHFSSTKIQHGLDSFNTSGNKGEVDFFYNEKNRPNNAEHSLDFNNNKDTDDSLTADSDDVNVRDVHWENYYTTDYDEYLRFERNHTRIRPYKTW